MLGGRDRDHDGHEGERRPADKAKYGVGAGLGKGGGKVGDDDEHALHQAGRSQDVDERGKHSRHGRNDAVEQPLLDLGRFGTGGVAHQLGHLLVDILGVGADDDLVLAAVLHDLDDGGHLGDLLGDLGRGGFFQHKAQAGGAVSCADDVIGADSFADIGRKLGIIADLGSHSDFSFTVRF